MTKQQFLTQLKDKLMSKGLSESDADARCNAISRNFEKISETDAAKYYTESNIDMIVTKITKSVETDTSTHPVQAPTIVIPKGESTNKIKESTDNSLKTAKTDDVVIIKNGNEKSEAKNRFSSIKVDNDSDQHPRLLLWILAILCAPTLFLVVFTILGLSLSIAVAMAGLIILLVTAIAAIVCGGSGLSAIALIYGITQIISEPRYVGLHEIGLAMMFAGITIAVSIILYNIAVRFIPLLYRLIGKALRVGWKKLKHFAVAAWKECENL